MKKTLKIYFTSDMHGYFAPIDYATGRRKAAGLANLIPQFVKDGNTLLLDGGDTIQGSPFAYLQAQGGSARLFAECMNLAGYDYVTLGNHDFNFGYEYLASFLENLKAPCLCANITDVTGRLPILPSALKRLDNGLCIGIIGICTDFINVWEKKGNLTKIRVGDVREALASVYGKLRSEADVLIGIYHGGFERDIETGRVLSTTRENIGYEIARDFGFDLLLTGHQHMAIADAVIAGTHIMQTPANAEQFAEAELIWEDGRIVSCRSALHSAGDCSDPRVLQLLEEPERETAAWLDAPKGHFEAPLLPGEHLEMALHGSGIADFFNQVQLWASGAQLSTTSLGNEVKGFNTDVTVRDIVSTYIYPNTLVIKEVTGEVLCRMLERSAEYFDMDEAGNLRVSRKFLEPKIAHYNFDYIMGIDYGFDCRRPEGSRVTHMLYQGRPVEAEQRFTMVMNNYRASGTGGYEFLRECPTVREILTDMVELILRYFEEQAVEEQEAKD